MEQQCNVVPIRPDQHLPQSPAAPAIPRMSEAERKLLAYYRSLDHHDRDLFILKVLVHSSMEHRLHDVEPSPELKDLMQASRREKEHRKEVGR